MFVCIILILYHIVYKQAYYDNLFDNIIYFWI